MKSTNFNNITIVGCGYVGMSLSILLSRQHSVTVYDINKKKVSLINDKKSPIKDEKIDNYLTNKELNLFATNDIYQAYKDSDCIIICTPTNFNDQTNKFDTSLVNSVIKDCIKINPNAFIVIKSTVPVGYTDSQRKLHNSKCQRTF